MKKLITIIYFFLTITLFSQDFLMQAWYWDYPKTANGFNWTDTLTNKAQELSQAGFTYLWLPPLSRASFGNNSNGYDPKDLYDLGEFGLGPTGFGTRTDVDELITELSNAGIKAVADVVYNHRDGGKPEDNPAVKNYINSYTSQKVDDGYNPFPYDRYRCYIPLGGTSGNGAGDYYFKVSSISEHSNFNNFEYKIYMQTNTVGWQNQNDEPETEPNGGGDCGQDNDAIHLGINLNAVNDDYNNCKTDEFHLSLTANDFDPAGDTLFIYFGKRNSGYSDMRIYGIWSGVAGADISNQLVYQTYTDFTNMPSGKGGMNFENFKPNTTNATKLDGFWDGLWFFYDYDQNVQATKDTLFAWTKWLMEDVGISGLRMDAVKHFSPNFTAQLFDYLAQNNVDLTFNVGEFYDNDVNKLKDWINSVNQNKNISTKNPRVFDFALREALRSASDAYGYDVRNVFNAGVVDGAGMNGFNVVTFLNNHDTRDSSHVVLNDPILGYTYILTNNKVGMPAVFYPDYYTMPDYKPFPSYNIPGMKKEIDELWDIHKKYILNASSIDYLNRFSSPYTQNFNSGFPNTTLLYQIMNTTSGRDLLVGINYAGDTLNVEQQINSFNAVPGKVFVNLLNNSANQFTYVDANSRVNIKVPPRDYSVWIEGVTVQAKVFLQGAYNTQTHLMNTTLRDNNLLPFTSPYLKDKRTVENINSTIVDWVLVELYDELSNEPLSSKSVFVKNDGYLCLEDGTIKIPMNAPDGNYYLVITHRNHLKIASAEKINVSASTSLYDFTGN